MTPSRSHVDVTAAPRTTVDRGVRAIGTSIRIRLDR
jgi:hypothetical protein